MLFGPTYNYNLETTFSTTTIYPTLLASQASTTPVYDELLLANELSIKKNVKTAFQVNPDDVYLLTAARDTFLRLGWNYAYWIGTGIMFDEIFDVFKKASAICLEGRLVIPLPKVRTFFLSTSQSDL